MRLRLRSPTGFRKRTNCLNWSSQKPAPHAPNRSGKPEGSRRKHVNLAIRPASPTVLFIDAGRAVPKTLLGEDAFSLASAPKEPQTAEAAVCATCCGPAVKPNVETRDADLTCLRQPPSSLALE